MKTKLLLILSLLVFAGCSRKGVDSVARAQAREVAARQQEIDRRLGPVLDNERAAAYAKGARDALDSWMLLDLELSVLAAKPMRNGERAITVAERLKIEPSPSWRAAIEAAK